MKNISHEFKKYFFIFSDVSIRKSNVTLKELRSIAKSGNIDGYKSMSKDQSYKHV